MAIEINRTTVVTEANVGGFNFTRTKNGVAVTRGKNTFNVPNGELGQAFVTALSEMIGGSVSAPKAKRTRRTKAQIEADNAAASSNSEVNE